MSMMHRRAKIGPNAITRVAETLRFEVGETRAASLFAAAGLLGYYVSPPEAMVDEDDVARLHRQLRLSFDAAHAAHVSRVAGIKTADYLLARRIPKPVQWVLLRLPPALASRALLSAIRRHAWTFAGSGVFTAYAGSPVRLEIKNNPLCRGSNTDGPACDYFAATFERLFQVLVHPAAKVTVLACEAAGAPSCVFEVRW
jgi:divinyl protochlorophyllide a 8-vinyl-reductase